MSLRRDLAKQTLITAVGSFSEAHNGLVTAVGTGLPKQPGEESDFVVTITRELTDQEAQELPTVWQGFNVRYRVEPELSNV
jgi:hypothetical protein